MSNIPISTGTGAASVATEQIGAVNYQQIKVVDGTAASTNKWVVNSDGSAQVSVVGTVAITGSVVAVGGGSVSGTVGASILGWVPIQASNTSIISYIQNSVATVIIGGSVAASFTPPANQSVSGAVSVSNFPTTQNVSGSVVSYQLPGSVLATSATFTPSGNQSVSGTVGASVIGTVPVTQSGINISSIVSSIPSSVLVGASIFGQLPAGTAPLGSVATLQGTNPWIVTNVGSIASINIGSVITVWKDSSVLAVPTSSTITIWQTPSIVGTFSDDAAHAVGAKGVFVMGVRNDTMSSVTSADNDYTLFNVGPTGEQITANAPITKWVRGTADLRVVQGASVTAIAAQGDSLNPT